MNFILKRTGTHQNKGFWISAIEVAIKISESFSPLNNLPTKFQFYPLCSLQQ
jgi:hypothetical protein